MQVAYIGNFFTIIVVMIVIKALMTLISWNNSYQHIDMRNN